MSIDTKKTKLGMNLRRIPRGNKLYRGGYHYFRGDNLYSEEEFEVWKDKKDMSMSFFSKLLSRVATGEILSIYVDYVINKDFTPQHILIEKSLGSEIVTEIYDYNRKNNQLDYIFISKEGESHATLAVSTNFHICTPVTATSMLFLRSKREDSTSKNYYYLFQNYNQWSFVERPTTKIVCMERMTSIAENITLDGTTVQATQYKLYEENPEQDASGGNAPIVKPEFLRVYISKFSTIPYLIRADDGTRVQIKYLNDLNDD